MRTFSEIRWHREVQHEVGQEARPRRPPWNQCQSTQAKPWPVLTIREQNKVEAAVDTAKDQWKAGRLGLNRRRTGPKD